MAATFDPNLATNRDWVRFLIGDVDTANAQLQDQTIEAILVEEPNKYLAAASAGGLILSSGGADVVSKKVGDLQVDYGGGASNEIYRDYLKGLRERGARDLLRTSGNPVFRVV